VRAGCSLPCNGWVVSPSLRVLLVQVPQSWRLLVKKGWSWHYHTARHPRIRLISLNRTLNCCSRNSTATEARGCFSTRLRTSVVVMKVLAALGCRIKVGIGRAGSKIVFRHGTTGNNWSALVLGIVLVRFIFKQFYPCSAEVRIVFVVLAKRTPVCKCKGPTGIGEVLCDLIHITTEYQTVLQIAPYLISFLRHLSSVTYSRSDLLGWRWRWWKDLRQIENRNFQRGVVDREVLKLLAVVILFHWIPLRVR